jgi:hypothetical protein
VRHSASPCRCPKDEPAGPIPTWSRKLMRGAELFRTSCNGYENQLRSGRSN